MRELKILFEHGKVHVDAIGFQGPECLAATAEIEKLLAGEVAREVKPEMNARPGAGQAVRAGGGG